MEEDSSKTSPSRWAAVYVIGLAGIGTLSGFALGFGLVRRRYPRDFGNFDAAAEEAPARLAMRALRKATAITTAAAAVLVLGAKVLLSK